jgi:hypothetical protein
VLKPWRHSADEDFPAQKHLTLQFTPRHPGTDRGRPHREKSPRVHYRCESAQPPRIAPARGPPLWTAATAYQQAGNDPPWDLSAQPEPEIEFDQRIAW